MPGPAQPADRHDPMPGLFGLPAHLLRQLSPRARRIVLAALAVLLAACVVTAIVVGPQIAESNRERAAQQRLDEQRAQAQERARLEAEQRPRTGKLAAGDLAAAIAGVEEAITRDARARHASGELHTLVKRTDCHPLGRRAGRVMLGCTAITSEVKPSEVTRGLTVGYPFRAAVSPETGRYGLCKTSGRPGEGSYTRGHPRVELPRVCGG
jgi:type II secretory pathway pseudopilin PulG